MMIRKKVKTISVSSAKTSPNSEQLLLADKGLLIDIDNLFVNYSSDTVLKNVSLCFHAGEFVGLIGPNGAGKTTLLKVMLGLLKPTKGMISRQPGVAVGYVPQRGPLQNIQVPMSVKEVASLGTKDLRNVHEALREVNMANFAQARFNELSGGQQQRVLMAKALATKPNLLILDEPTTGVDEASQEAFNRILHSLQAKNVTIIMVSHDINSVLRQVQRVVYLQQSVLYDGPPETFEANHYKADFYAKQHHAHHHKNGRHV